MIQGEVCPDKGKTAENCPTEAQWLDPGRPEVQDLIHSSVEAPILLLSHPTPGAPGGCRFKQGHRGVSMKPRHLRIGEEEAPLELDALAELWKTKRSALGSRRPRLSDSESPSATASNSAVTKIAVHA